jgi:hypothetical protein
VGGGGGGGESSSSGFDGGGGAGVSVGGRGVLVLVGVTMIRLRVGVGLGVAVGVDEGDGDGVGVVVGSTSSEVALGEGVRVAKEPSVSVAGTSNSVTTGSSPGLAYISLPERRVRVSVSSAQVTAPSSTARRVTSLVTSLLIRVGTFRSSTGQAGITSS